MDFTAASKFGYAKDYHTHLNYAHCMVGMMHDVAIAIPVNKSVRVSVSDVKRFIKLSNLTKTSIEGEITSCHTEPDYVQIVAPWFAVKCYYRAYYLESALIHLSSGSMEPFKNGGHHYVRKTIRTFCKAGYITSTLRHAEVVEKYTSALTHKIVSGTNIKQDYYLSEDCVKSVRSKLARYSVEHWKRNSTHKNFRPLIARKELADYISKNEVCLFDFFYQMRIKANYRDADFLDFDKIESNEGITYIEQLKKATDKYCRALESAIANALSERSIAL